MVSIYLHKKQPLRSNNIPVNTQSTEERIRQIIIKQFVVGERIVTRQTSFVNDLEADSLDTAELIMEFEEAFKMNISDEDAEKMQTVGDVVDYIEEYTRKEEY